MGAGDASCGGDGDGGGGNGGGGGQPWNAAAALMNLIHITCDSQRGSRRSSCAKDGVGTRQVDEARRKGLGLIALMKLHAIRAFRGPIDNSPQPPTNAQGSESVKKNTRVAVRDSVRAHATRERASEQDTSIYVHTDLHPKRDQAILGGCSHDGSSGGLAVPSPYTRSLPSAGTKTSAAPSMQ